MLIILPSRVNAAGGLALASDMQVDRQIKKVQDVGWGILSQTNYVYHPRLENYRLI